MKTSDKKVVKDREFVNENPPKKRSQKSEAEQKKAAFDTVRERHEVCARFDKLIGLLGMTRNQFAQKIGMAATQIYNVCNGENAPSHNMYKKIATWLPAVNLVWLIAGEGEPIDRGTWNKSKRLLSKVAIVENQMAEVMSQMPEDAVDQIIGVFKDLQAKREASSKKSSKKK